MSKDRSKLTLRSNSPSLNNPSQSIIAEMEKQADLYSRSIEQQLQKQQDLKNLLQDTKKRGRMQQTQTPDDIDCMTLEQLLKKERKIQYDIQQIINKNNEINAMVNEMKEIVDRCRSERVIFSSIFKNLEKEIHQNENKYKELIADRLRIEHEKNMPEPPALQLRMKSDSLAEPEMTAQEATVSLPQPPTPAMVRRTVVYSFRSRRGKQPDELADSKPDEVQPQPVTDDMPSEFYIKKIFSQLGVSSIEEIQQLMGSIDGDNDRLFNKSNELFEQVYSAREQLETLEKELARMKTERDQMEAKEKDFLVEKETRAKQRQAESKYNMELEGLQELIRQAESLVCKVYGEERTIDQTNLIAELQQLESYMRLKGKQHLDRAGQKDQDKMIIQATLDNSDRKDHSEQERIFSKNDFIENSRQQLVKLYQQKKMAIRKRN